MEEIRRIQGNKKALLPLLLDADPCEAMVDRYLARGEMYVLYVDGKAVCEAVVTWEGPGRCELKNLATAPGWRGRGYASRLVRHLAHAYAAHCDVMLVGTSLAGRGFYRRLGFTDSHVLPGFFCENYPEPIYENGVRCTDMYVLALRLRPGVDGIRLQQK